MTPQTTDKLSLSTIATDNSEWQAEMLRLGYLDPQTMRPSSTVLKPSSVSLRDDMVTRTIVNYVCEFRYNENDDSDIYWRMRGQDDPYVFRKFPYDKKALRTVVVRYYAGFFDRTSHKETEACLNNIMDNISEKADLRNGVWYAARGLFWDSVNSVLIGEDQLRGRASFREVGCSSRNKAVKPELVLKSFNHWTDLLEEKTAQYGDFENFYTQLPIEHDHFKLWACVDSEGLAGVDKYWDMCVATSTIFMYSPPPVAYVPKGKPRGGKSTFIKHLHYLVGDWQTTDIMISQLADYHMNNQLYGSLLNAPDEDKSGALSDECTAVFKSLAAKERCSLPVMYSGKPKKFEFKSMMFFPRNALPDFGRESAACMKRLRFIFCNADLSEYDKKPIDFIKVTFKDNPDYLAEYLGFILALSGYFQKHGMWYSKTMQKSTEYVSETVNSTGLYYNIWKKYFLGYSSFPLLWEDYRNFCRVRGYKMETKEVLRDTFSLEGSNRIRKYYAPLKGSIWMYVTNANKCGSGLVKLGFHIMCPEEYYDGYGTLQDRVMEGDGSVVDLLDERARVAQEKFYGGAVE